MKLVFILVSGTFQCEMTLVFFNSHKHADKGEVKEPLECARFCVTDPRCEFFFVDLYNALCFIAWELKGKPVYHFDQRYLGGFANCSIAHL